MNRSAINDLASREFRELSIRFVLAELLLHGYVFENKRSNAYLVIKDGVSSLVCVRAKKIGVESPMTGVDYVDIARYEKRADGLKALFGFVAWVEKSKEIHICIFELKDIAAVGKTVKSGYNLRIAELEEKVQILQDKGKFAVYQRMPNVVQESDLLRIIDEREQLSFDPESIFSNSGSASVETSDSVAFAKNEEKLHGYNRTLKASDINEPPERVKCETLRIIRDTRLSQEIKELNDYTCQVCRKPLFINEDENIKYAEAHHIQPLGKPHNGLDVAENMICVCPNCHALLDQRAIKLPAKIEGAHEIGQEYIDYHNDIICGEELGAE